VDPAWIMMLPLFLKRGRIDNFIGRKAFLLRFLTLIQVDDSEYFYIVF
jgi:hypothetical protein